MLMCSLSLILVSLTLFELGASHELEICDASQCQTAVACWKQNKEGVQARAQCVQDCLTASGLDTCAETLKKREEARPAPAEKAVHHQCVEEEACKPDNIQLATERYLEHVNKRKDNGKWKRHDPHHHHHHHGHGCRGGGLMFVQRVLLKAPEDTEVLAQLKTCIASCNNCQKCGVECKLHPILRFARKQCHGNNGNDHHKHHHKWWMNREEKKALCECILNGAGVATDNGICDMKHHHWHRRGHGKGGKSSSEGKSTGKSKSNSHSKSAETETPAAGIELQNGFA